MRRRDFLWIAGAVTALPRLALAQQPAKLPRVAFLSIPIAQEVWDTVVGGLADAGYVDGKTMTLNRFTAPSTSDLTGFAARAVAVNPDVLVTIGSAPTLEAKKATTTIPIVFQSNAPVENGLVASLAHPGGNLTGVSNTAPDLAGKQLGILKETLPSMRRIAVLNLPVGAGVQITTDSVRAAAPALGIEPEVIDFVEGRDFAEQFQRVQSSGADAVYVPAAVYFGANRGLLYDLQLKTQLAQLWGQLTQPFTGVLAYAVNAAVQYRRMAGIVDAVLKGAKPSDVPVEQPTVYELAVNLKTAKAIGITIPQSILAQATQVFE